MASVNWMKATKQKAGGLKKHLGKKERVELNHSNTHINKELSHLNYSIGCSDYNEALLRMNERTKEVDAVLPPKRIRKDRVTCCFLEVPCPKQIAEQGRSDEFFRNIHELYRNFFGAENVHGTMVHKDEVHEYIDAHKKVKKMSLEHAHTLVSSFTPSKGINGKAFETKTRLNALNKAVNAMCMQSFGISFNTGENANNEQLEVLKTKSAEVKRQQIENQVLELQNQVHLLQNQALSYKQPKKKKLMESQSSYNERMKIEAQALATQQLQQQLDLREQELRRLEYNAEKKEQNAQNVINKNNSLERELSEVIEKYNHLVPRYNELIKSSEAHKKENENLRNALENLYEKHTGEYLPYDYILEELNPPKQQQQKNDIDFNLTM